MNVISPPPIEFCTFFAVGTASVYLFKCTANNRYSVCFWIDSGFLACGVDEETLEQRDCIFCTHARLSQRLCEGVESPPSPGCDKISSCLYLQNGRDGVEQHLKCLGLLTGPESVCFSARGPMKTLLSHTTLRLGYL